MPSSSRFVLLLLLPPVVPFQQATLGAVFVGYEPSTPFVTPGLTPLRFQPDETLWITATRSERIELVKPDGALVATYSLTPQSQAVFHFTRDLPSGNYSLRRGDGETLVQLLFDRALPTGRVELALALSSGNLTATIVNSETRLAYFMTPGSPNVFEPGQDVTRGELRRLGNLRMPLGTVVELQHLEAYRAGANASFAPQEVQVNLTVTARRIRLPEGAGSAVDLDRLVVLQVPLLHQIGVGGVAPLRYGRYRLLVLRTDPYEVLDAREVVVLPSRSGVTGSLQPSYLHEGSVTPDVIRPRVVFADFDPSQGRATLRVVPAELPIAWVTVRDPERNETIRDFELEIPEAQITGAGETVQVLYLQQAGLIPLPDRLQAPLRVTPFLLRIADFLVAGASPSELAFGSGVQLEIHVVTRTLAMQFLLDPPSLPITVTLRHGEETIPLPAVNQTLLVPRGRYTLAVQAPDAEYAWDLDLSTDNSIVVPVRLRPVPPALVFQVIAILEAVAIAVIVWLRRARL